MHPLVWIAAAIGAVAIWRRKHLKDDTEKVKTAATGAKSAASEKIAAARGGSASESTDDAAGDSAGSTEADAGDAADESTGGGTEDENASE